MDGKKIPKSGNWVTFDKGIFTFKPTQEHVGIHPITINAYDIDGHTSVKTKVISVTVEDVNVTHRTDIADITIKEGHSGEFMLPEFAQLLPHMDLSDNVIHSTLDDKLWGLDLSLNDLTGVDTSNWTFFDSDFGTNKGDRLFYSATIDGVTIPEKNNWITFSKGTFSYSPLHQHVGVHNITVTATDLSGNKSHFKFKLTVQDLHTRSKLEDKEMFTGEVLEVKLPEFEAMINDLSDNIFTTKEGDMTFYGLDLSLNDLSNNSLWEFTKNDLVDKTWNFFDPNFGTNKGDKVLYKAYINDKLIEDHLHRDEGQFATFKKGVLRFMPFHNDNGKYKVKIVTTDLSGNETIQEFELNVKSKYSRNDISDMNVNEGEELVYVLPEFRDLLAKFDLSDNVFDENGIDLSLNDLSNNALWDLTNNKIAGSATDWKFFDDDYATLKEIKQHTKLRLMGK